MKPTFRFAPSPNGRLHLGHAYSAWLNARLAERLDGQFLVRLEDIDTTRCTAELAEQCLADLTWLGLTWEEPVRIQSQHWKDYIAAADRLKAHGLLYPCFCSRREVAEASIGQDPDGAPLYSGTCLQFPGGQRKARMAAGDPYALRLDMACALALASPPLFYTCFDPETLQEKRITTQPERWGDAVLVRKEIPTSYHLSVVVDDALQGITHVMRGADLEAATHLHVLLQALLDLPTPHYCHHGLITDEEGKLSKSKGSESLADLRARSITADELRKMLAERCYASLNGLPKSTLPF